jgi:hypothetical protein
MEIITLYLYYAGIKFQMVFYPQSGETGSGQDQPSAEHQASLNL